jgi:hypothetical protein
VTLTYIGKESNRLEEARANLVHGLDEVLTAYGDPRQDAWLPLAVPVLRDFRSKRLQTGLRSTVERFNAS